MGKIEHFLLFLLFSINQFEYCGLIEEKVHLNLKLENVSFEKIFENFLIFVFDTIVSKPKGHVKMGKYSSFNS